MRANTALTSRTTSLKGVAWDHTRGLMPMVASAKAWTEQHPDVTIAWATRSLWHFGQGDVGEFADTDLVVIDHPLIGSVVERGLVRPLDDLIPGDLLDDLERTALGSTFESYRYRGRLYALPIDAAMQVACLRPDLLGDTELPRTWAGTVEFAQRSGQVLLPLSPIDVAQCFFTVCTNLDGGVGQTRERLVDPTAGQAAWRFLLGIADAVDPTATSLRPPDVLRIMTTTDEVSYCPLIFGYSNYAREGYAPHPVRFVELGPGKGGTLGGAGLALTTTCGAVDAAVAYASWVAGEACQRTLYWQAGGQPAHRSAWTDELANRATGGFFESTLAGYDGAFVRPNLAGFDACQDEMAGHLHAALIDRADYGSVAVFMDRLWTQLQDSAGASS